MSFNVSLHWKRKKEPKGKWNDFLTSSHAIDLPLFTQQHNIQTWISSTQSRLTLAQPSLLFLLQLTDPGAHNHVCLPFWSEVQSFLFLFFKKFFSFNLVLLKHQLQHQPTVGCSSSSICSYYRPTLCPHLKIPLLIDPKSNSSFIHIFTWIISC